MISIQQIRSAAILILPLSVCSVFSIGEVLAKAKKFIDLSLTTSYS
jgi:hypothetical protein